jgi:basic membrane lipoprotein Med (substrate-binding protein (PBP1-ABC) superfamily)
VAGGKWTALVAVVAIAAGSAGCGGGNGGTKVTNVGLVSPGRANDVDWVTQAREAFEDLVDKLHLRGEKAEEVPTARAAAAVETLAGSGAQLVIAHDGSYAAAAAAAAERGKARTLVWGDPGALKANRVGDIEVDAGPAAYAVGVIASHASIRRRFGIVIANDGGSWEARTWDEMAGGFVAGLRSVDPRSHITLVRVGADGQATAAEAQAAGT